MAEHTHAGARRAGTVPIDDRHVGDRDRGRRSRGVGRWLLPLLALLALAIVLIVLLSGGDERKDEQAQQAQTAEELRAGDRTVGLRQGALKPLVGEEITGRGLRVQAVNPNEGFWVGTGKRDRFYVEYGRDVGGGEGAFGGRVGERVDLAGPVRAAPQDPGELLRLTPPDAAQVKAEGAYVNADRVTRK